MTGYNEKKQHPFYDILAAKVVQPESNHKETPVNPKLRDKLQNNWPVFFKSVMVMKVRERPRLRKTRET